jgi:hypothetical protein
LNITVTVQITAASGKPVVTVTNANVNIENIDIKLHGGASWLYNFFIGILKGTIVHAIDTALSNAVTTNVDNGVNTALSTLPMSLPINSKLSINYEILNNPVFTAGYVSVYQEGSKCGYSS